MENCDCSYHKYISVTLNWSLHMYSEIYWNVTVTLLCVVMNQFLKIWARETAKWVSSLLCKEEHLGLSPHDPHKIGAPSWMPYTPVLCERDTDGSRKLVDQIAELPKWWASGWVWDPVSENIADTYWGGHLRSSWPLLAHMYIHTHVQHTLVI